MDDNAKKNLIKNIIGNQTVDVTTYLAEAKSDVLNQLYPFGYESTTEVPAQYEMIECQLASRYYFRSGSEGEISNTENGISRTYGSVDNSDLLTKIIPYARLLGESDEDTES